MVSVGGIKELGVLPLEPFLIDKMEISQQADSPVNLEMVYTNIQMYGITGNKIQSIKGFDKDPLKSKVEISMFNEQFNFISDYDLNGRVLVLPVQGKGRCNLTFEGIDSTIKFTPKVVSKNGKDYLQIKKMVFHIKPSNLIMHFDNLFNGDKALTKTINEFLNQNWREIFDELRVVLDKSFGQVMQSIIDSVFIKIPYSELFLE